jgi:hypothetical protein
VDCRDAALKKHPSPPAPSPQGEGEEQRRAREDGASDVTPLARPGAYVVIAEPLRLDVLREKLAQWIVATPR